MKALSYLALTVLAIAMLTTAALVVLKFFALEGLMIFSVCCASAFWGWVIYWLHSSGRITFSHILVIWLVASGTIMSGASYYLAYREITATLETLSRYVMVETVAGSAGYFIKSAVENATNIITNKKRDM